jgi:hypothetical protein
MAQRPNFYSGDIRVLKTGIIGKPQIFPPSLHRFSRSIGPIKKLIVKKCPLALPLLEYKMIYFFPISGWVINDLVNSKHTIWRDFQLTVLSVAVWIIYVFRSSLPYFYILAFSVLCSFYVSLGSGRKRYI